MVHLLESDGRCKVFSRQGTPLLQFQTVYDPVYNAQYGTPVSPDGRWLLMGSPDRGIHCYDLQLGAILWRKGPDRVRSLFVTEDSVVAEVAGEGVQARELLTGELRHDFPLVRIGVCRQVGREELFAGPGRDSYYLLRIPDLEVLGRVPLSRINPQRCATQMIRGAFRVGGRLTVWGWEEPARSARREGGMREFERSVVPRLECEAEAV